MAEVKGSNQAEQATPQAAAANSGQYLTFLLGGEEYGVSILSVKEIKSGENVTKIPRTPDYIQGVMNLRGAIVPVVDLRQRFKIEAMPTHAVNVVVILTVEGDDRRRTVGVIVDDVSDVYALSEDQIKPSPDFGAAISTEFIKGIATLDSNIVIVLDTNKLFSLDELSKMDALEPNSAGHNDPQE